MSSYEVKTIEDLIGWASSGKTTLNLMNDLEINSDNAGLFPINVVSGTSTFNGNKHTIKISGVSNFSGIFLRTSIFRTINMNNLNVHISDGTTVTNAVIFTSSWYSGSITITDCSVTGDYDIPEGCSPFLGKKKNGVGSSGIIMTGCYSTGRISGKDAGGIIGSIPHYNAIVTNCYSTGIISGERAGGIVGYNTNATITGCYSTGTITTTYGGGIYGHHENASVIMKNCASYGLYIKGGGLIGTVHAFTEDRSVALENCYFLNTTKITAIKFDTTYYSSTNVSHANVLGVWDEVLGDDVGLLDDGTWDDSITPFILNRFKSTPWVSSTYTIATDSAQFKNLINNNNNIIKQILWNFRQQKQCPRNPGTLLKITGISFVWKKKCTKIIII